MPKNKRDRWKVKEGLRKKRVLLNMEGQKTNRSKTPRIGRNYAQRLINSFTQREHKRWLKAGGRAVKLGDQDIMKVAKMVWPHSERLDEILEKRIGK